MNRFSCLHFWCCGTGLHPYFPLCAKPWTEPYDRICWNMFTHWLTYGINYMFNPHKHQWGDYKPALHKVNANPSLFCIGYECQSSGNSIEAYI